MAINDKNMPLPIKRLQRIAILILIILVGVAITEMVIVRNQLGKTQENFKMI